MAKSMFSQQDGHNKYKLTVQHVVIWAVIAVALFILFFFKVIPIVSSSFVVPLFQPTGEKLTKIGWVQFDGLVWASTNFEKGKELKGKNAQIKKKDIDGNYIFDFSFKERTFEENGYVKGTSEWFLKTEILGENPIILEPWVGFWILALVLSIVITCLLTIVMPYNFGFLSVLFERQIDNTKAKIRLQTGFNDEIVELLCMPEDILREKDWTDVEKAYRIIWDRTNTEETSVASKQTHRFEDYFNENTDIVAFRQEIILGRIKEFFSDFVVKEIEDTKDGLVWRRQKWQIGKGLRIYMAHHFTEKYSNNVTGMAYGGAAFLIVAVGIRGLKFIPSTKPSFILLAIFLEFSMLMLLAVTLFYTEEEERMDRMLKKMEDASRIQLDTLKGQTADIHQLTNALVGQTADIIKSRVEMAVSQYLSSDNNIHKTVAEEISRSILISMRETYDKK